MKRLAVAAVVAAVAAGAGLAAGPAPAPELRLKGHVDDLSADGPWVAVQTSEERPKFEFCNGVVLWNVVTGKKVEVGLGAAACESSDAFAYWFGFAGGRVVWTSYEEQRYPVCSVWTATVTASRARLIHECPADSETGYGAGQEVGAWAGDGPLLVGSVAYGDSGCDTDCDSPLDTGLIRVVGQRLRQVREGQQTLVVRSVSGNRIATLRPDGAVGVLDPSGRVLRVLPFRPKQVREVAIDGNDLLVKKETELAVYDARSGALRKTWKLRAGSALVDAHAGIAVLIRADRVQLLGVTDGHGDAYTAPGAVAGAALEAAGLVYAYNRGKETKATARVLFVPFARVERRLR